jgi:MFS family permease
VQENSTRTLIAVVVLFFFTSNLTGSFLPIYYKDEGLSVPEICALLFFTFLPLGLLPAALLKTVKNFERVMSLGIFASMLFLIALIYIRNPIILGFAYGTSLAMFWPSFNLLLFRLSESSTRARTIGVFSTIIPSLASIVGPATGGLIIERLSFTSLFATSTALYFTAFLLSTRIHYKPEEYEFSLPRNRMFTIFLATFVISAATDTYWLAYPFFVYNISGTVLNMGLILTTTGILISVITFSISWASDIKRARIEFAMIGTILSAAWYFGISFASSTEHLIMLSLLSGFANAFRISWFAHYGDTFGREYYASILVVMETSFMVGRVINLVPTYFLVEQADYAAYFTLLGATTLLLIPLYAMARKSNSANHA